jgi:acetolactate synthase-1/2/3 large subunit
MDSVPIVAITGQVAPPLIGTDAFQEADITGITMPVTKHNMLVTDAAEIPRAIAEAFHLASTGRPGPVLVDISKDALQAKTTFVWPPELRLPGYRPTTRPHGKQIREAAKLISRGAARCSTSAAACSRPRPARKLRAAGRADEHPGDHHADGAGCLPGQPPAARRHARHARQGVRGRCAAEGGPARCARGPLRRSGHRPARDVRPGREDRARRHRPGRDREEPPRGRPIVGDCKEVLVDLLTAVEAERRTAPPT